MQGGRDSISSASTPRLFPHTAAKHFLLDRYLKAWFPIATSLPTNRVNYIDGFAGPGFYDGQPGSPLIALRALTDHRYYPRMKDKKFTFWFIEKVQKTANELDQMIAKLDLPEHISTRVECGAFASAIDRALDQVDSQGSRLAPTFAFVDPFGFSHTPMATIARFANYQASEVFITLIFENVYRFLSGVKEKVNAHYTRLFGTDEWMRGRRLHGLRRRRFLRDLYERQLRNAGFQFVKYFEMRDEGDRVEYYLFFCTNHELGLEKMMEAMWAMDPSGRYRFSDKTAKQTVLFTDEPDLKPLARRIRKQFKERDVPIKQVDRFVITVAGYLRKHRKAVLDVWEDNKRIRIISAPPKRRRHTWGADVVVRIVR